jgi:hypothetical protein
MHHDENNEGLEIDDEDLLAVSALTEEDIAAIDSAILAEARIHWGKVAMVVIKAMDAYPDKYLDIPDSFYGQRVLQLVLSGKLQSQGNLCRMRFSEVCLPSTD